MDPDAQGTMDKETGKRQAGHAAAEMIGDDMIVGLGTGSTVLYAMENLSRRSGKACGYRESRRRTRRRSVHTNSASP